QEVAGLVNAVTGAYQKIIVDEDKNRRRARIDQLRSLYEKIQSSLFSQREDHRRMAAQVGLDNNGSLAYAQQLLLGQLDVAKSRLNQARKT
ncbi:MAG: hypothetical protein WKF75_19360, partial [Singulisphaera sp.]